MCICLLEQFTASSVNLHSKNSAPGHVVFSYDCPISRSSYIQKVLCSEGPMFRKYLFRWSFIQKVLCLEGSIFKRSCIQKIFVQKVLCWNTFPSFSFMYKNIFFISVHFTLLFHFLHDFIIHFFLGYTLLSSEDPTFSELQISKFPKFW